MSKYYRTLNRISLSELNKSLISGWKFDENLNDVKNIYNGTIINNISYVNGIDEFALLIDDSTSGVSFGNANIFTFENGKPFSISVFVNLQNFGSNLNSIISKRSGSTNNSEWQFVYHVGQKRWQFQKYSNGVTSGQQQIFIPNSFPTLNTWYHLCYTDKGTGDINDCKIYLDGVDLTNRISVGTYVDMIDTSSDVRINLNPNGNGNLMVDELYIFNKELSVEEIDILYNGPKQFFPF